MSTALAYAIFATALALPPPYGEREPVDAREFRLANLAAAIDEAADGEPDRAAALLTTAWAETRLSRHVHMQGPRRDKKGYAISLWSLHSWTLVPFEEWRGLGGLDGTERAAVAADRVLQWTRKRCGTLTGMYSLYATGRVCSWSGAGPRVWLHRRILRRLEEA